MSSQSDWKEIVKLALEGILLPIVGSLGVIGNIASMAVLQSK